MRRTTLAALATLGAALAVTAVPTSVSAAPTSKPDTACMRAGISTLKSVGLFSTVARSGLPLSVAGSYGVIPRAGTDVAALPDPLPLKVVLADHRAGENSLFIYPWC